MFLRILSIMLFAVLLPDLVERSRNAWDARPGDFSIDWRCRNPRCGSEAVVVKITELTDRQAVIFHVFGLEI